MTYLGIKKHRTTSYHPQANGLVERFHRSMKASLMARLEHSPTTWPDELPVVLLGLRNSVKSDLGCSAADMVFGQSLHLPGTFFETPSGRPSGPEIITSFKKAMSSLKFKVCQHHTAKNKPTYVPKALMNATHVYVQRIAVIPHLQAHMMDHTK